VGRSGAQSAPVARRLEVDDVAAAQDRARGLRSGREVDDVAAGQGRARGLRSGREVDDVAAGQGRARRSRGEPAVDDVAVAQGSVRRAGGGRRGRSAGLATAHALPPEGIARM